MSRGWAGLGRTVEHCALFQCLVVIAGHARRRHAATPAAATPPVAPPAQSCMPLHSGSAQVCSQRICSARVAMRRSEAMPRW